MNWRTPAPRGLTLLRRIKYAAVTACRKRMVRIESLDRVSGGEVLEHFPAQPTETADCLSMPFDLMANHLRKVSYMIPAGSSRVLGGVSYCGPNNMLLTRSRRIVAESSSTEREPQWFKWEHLFQQEKKHLKGLCSSIRSLRNNYYHTVVDNVPRLLLLSHPVYADQEIKLLFPGGPTPVESFFLDRLCPPNVTIVDIDPGFHYSCDEFLLANFLSRRFAGFLPYQYLEFFHKRVLPSRPRQPDKRILISRKKAPNGRCVLNEDELATALLPFGFKAYILEDLDFESQIELFYDAEVVVAPHGAGLTNLLFAQAADVIELHPNPQLFPHYYFMCKSLGHRYQYWCGTQTSRFSAFWVDIPAVLKLVAARRGR